MKDKIINFINTRIGFMSLLITLIWIKSIFAYLFEFKLGVSGLFQYIILIINPIATSLLLVSLGMYIKSAKTSYITMFLLYVLTTLLIFSNVVYYREFSDFITINTFLGAGKVASGLGESALRLFRIQDILFIADFIFIPILLWKRTIRIDSRQTNKRLPVALSALSVMLFLGNLTLAEISRPELLTRTFSRDYLVKYLGITAFTGYDGIQTYKTFQVRAQASENDIDSVVSYVKGHQAKENDDYFGIAKDKNVIYIHLESTQQFLIDYKLKDENGVEHEVMPFINSLYHSNSTLSFDNVFHQVNAGKTSDAETLLDNSLFGLNQGALFTQLGSKNTFESAPQIVKANGYTSAVFHGNSGNFWNRNETYKKFGYDYFFDSNYYTANEDNSFQYGLHDKYFFKESEQYLNKLPQPFYAKMIAVSNHYPYSEIEGNEFPQANTSDETINGYFATAHYLDQSVKEFFDYLKESGLYDNSIIVLYGDHYGISNSRNITLSTLLSDSDESNWDSFDNAQLQRVPFMINIPGIKSGEIKHTYGGQVDILPTVLHLLGINTDNYLLLGQDLLSSEHENIVAFRNGSFVSSKYTYYDGKIYLNSLGEELVDLTDEQKKEINELKNKVNSQLETSDAINTGDLFRFYSDSGLPGLDSSSISYLNQVERLNKENENSTYIEE